METDKHRASVALRVLAGRTAFLLPFCWQDKKRAPAGWEALLLQRDIVFDKVWGLAQSEQKKN